MNMNYCKRCPARTALLLIVLAVFSPWPVFAASTCGPGAHWIDTCSAGTETFAIVMRFGLTTNIQALADYEAQFEGTMTVRRGDPVVLDPASDPGHANYINTEILSMDLLGTSPEVSGWRFRAGIDQGLDPTTGFIRETNDPKVALDWADLIFIIEGTPYGTLHHDGSLFFATSIDAWPPIGVSYSHTGSPFGTNFPLFDANNDFAIKLTDLFNTNWIDIGRPQYEIVSVVPLPPTVVLLVWGLLGLLIPSARKRWH